MQSKYSYPHEKFMLAVDGMATSPKSIQERIGSAYIYHLIHLQTAELPDEIQEKFDSLSQKLTCVEAKGNEGTVQATTEQMSEQDAIDLAQDIVNMDGLIRHHYYDI